MRAVVSSSGARSLTTSAVRAQAPRPPRLVPAAHVAAKTRDPRTPVDVARQYPDHPLMQFFQRSPARVAVPGTKGEHEDEKQTVHVPVALSEKDLEHEASSRSWLAPELRRKSSADLHTLWYVLHMERNRLATTWEELRRNAVTGPARMLGESVSYRSHRVRKSMARIKFVLNERRLALMDAQRRARAPESEPEPEREARDAQNSPLFESP